MSFKDDHLRALIHSLQHGTEDEQVDAAMGLRNLFAEANQRDVVRESGGIQALLQLLIQKEKAVTIASAETLACLAAEDSASRVRSTNPKTENIEIFPLVEL